MVFNIENIDKILFWFMDQIYYFYFIKYNLVLINYKIILILCVINS